MINLLYTGKSQYLRVKYDFCPTNSSSAFEVYIFVVRQLTNQILLVNRLSFFMSANICIMW